MSRKLTLSILIAVLVVAACQTISTRQSTSLELDRILAGAHRSEANRARDRHRHPKETLLFFGIRPEMKVLEVWPEPGWYTEVLAPLVRTKGQYTAAVIPPDPASRNIENRLDGYHQMLAGRPDLYDKVEVVTFPTDGSDVAPPNSLDMIVTFRNIHNWMARDVAQQAFASMYRALKPGGVLGVTEHRGNPAVPQDPHAKSGYVNEEYAIRMIEAQGFKLRGKSEINANHADTKDYEQGVWVLPPTFRLGEKDKAKYAAIGESDRFTLKFEKPKRP
jgi:predicted methyltransferase